MKWRLFKSQRRHRQYIKKPLFVLALLVLVAIGPGLYFLLRHPSSAQAAWFDSNWGFRTRMPVTNTSGSLQTDFQVLLTIDTATLITNGKLQSSCNDVRVTDQSGNILHTWIEPTTCNTTATKLWVKVPSIPTTGADLFFYYGNPSAQAQVVKPGDVFMSDSSSAAATWPLDDTTTTQSYSRVVNPAIPLGSKNIALNGTFDSGSGWSLDAYWTISGGVAHSGGGNVANKYLNRNDFPIIMGKTYQVTFTISNYVAGSCYGYTGNTASATHSGNGTYSEIILSGTSAPNSGMTAMPGFIGDIDNFTIQQVNIPASSSFTGAELLVDGNMEAVGTAAWIDSGSLATITKQIGTPHGGTQVLRILESNPTYGGAQQSPAPLTIGKTYHAVGYARSDGTALPKIMNGANVNVIWTGTTSASWQLVDLTFIAVDTRFELLTSNSTAGFYTEWDDMSVTEVDPLVGKPTNGVVLGSASGGHLTNAYTFDGTNDNVNVYSGDLNSVFNPSEGTIVLWAKNTGVWNDGLFRTLFDIQSDSNNRMKIDKDTGGTLRFYYIAGSTNKNISPISPNNANWFQIALTWSKSKDQFVAYYNGSQRGSAQTGLGIWAGNLSGATTVIGAENTSGANSWSGMINDVKLYTRALSPGEISAQYSASVDLQTYQSNNYVGHELIRKYNDLVTVGAAATEETGSGPVAYWKFDEGTGTSTQDASGRKNTGTLTGMSSPPTATSGWQTEDMCVNGKCLRFDGTDDFVEGSNSVSLRNATAMTAEAWIKQPSLAANNSILTEWDYQTQGTFSLKTDNTPGKILVYIATSVTDAGTAYGITSNVVLTANQWAHVVFVFDGTASGNNNRLKIYVNGIQQTLALSGTIPSSLTAGTATIKIGKFGGTATQYFSGSIDEPKIYPYARSAAQVKADYLVGASKIGGATAMGNQTPFLSNGLVGYWKMDEAQWSGVTGEVLDYSGNAAHGKSGGITGTSSGSNSSTTLNDTAKNWNTNVMANASITITGGTGSGQIRTIASNTSTQVTITAAWSPTPDNTSTYRITPSVVAGKFGNGGNFNSNTAGATTGLTGYIDVPNTTLYNFATTNSFTTCTWAKPTILSVGRMLFSHYGTSGWVFGFNGANLSAELQNNSRTFLSVATTPFSTTNTWKYICFVYDGTGTARGIKIYVDSQPQTLTIASDTLGGRSIAVAGVNLDLAAQGAGGNGFSGQLDEMRIYNRILSPDEIRQLYLFAPGPVGYWKMDETTGAGSTLADSSGYGNTGTVSLWGGGNVATDSAHVNGKYGHAFSFDGGDDYVSAGNSTNVQMTGSVTLEAWIQTSDSTGAIVNKFRSGPFAGYGLGVVSGQLRSWFYGTTTGYSTGTTNINDNKWHYVTAVYNSTTSTITMYVDGKNEGTTTGTPSLIDSVNSVWMGNDQTGSSAVGGPLSGQIDDVKVYNYARTQQQIIEDMRGTGNMTTGVDSSVQPATPVGYWKFDEGYSTAAKNSGSGGSALNGTLTNMAAIATSTSGWQNTGKVNKALAFDGSNDYVDAGASIPFANNSFSVSLWAKRANTSNQMYMFSIGTSLGGNTLAHFGFHSSTQLRFGFFINDLNVTISNDDVNWHHYVAIYDATAQIKYIYRDAKLIGTQTGSAAFTGTNTFNIGRRYDGGGSPWSGLLDEPKVFNFALNLDQVRQDYNAGATVNFGTGAASESAQLSDGPGAAPVGYWNFEEGTGGTVNDVSGQNNTGTWAGTGAKHWAPGKYGKGGKFNGTDDYIATSWQPSAVNNLSISAWIKRTNTTAAVYVIGSTYNVGNNHGFIFELYNTNKLGYWTTSSGHVQSTSTITDTNWHYVTVTVSATNSITFYIDGVSAGSGTASGLAPDLPFLIGAQNTVPSNTFNGLIDEVKVYNYVRTPAQIAYDYNRGLPVGWWKMDECQGTTLNDSSGNNNVGTLTLGASPAEGTCSTTGTAWGNGSSGKYNASMSFDGSDDYVSAPDTASLSITGNMTVSAWIKPTNLPTSSNMMSIVNKFDGSPNGGGYDLRLTNSSGTQLIGFVTKTSTGGNGGGDISYTLPTNQWSHVVGLCDGTNSKIYVNGNYVGQVTNTTGPGDNTKSLFIGQFGTYTPATPPGRYFNGLIDDVRIFNYALSGDQVKKLFNGGASAQFGP